MANEQENLPHPVAAPALKNPKEVGGGDVDVIFNLKVYPTNFMLFLFDNFADFWD